MHLSFVVRGHAPHSGQPSQTRVMQKIVVADVLSKLKPSKGVGIQFVLFALSHLSVYVYMQVG